VCFNKFQKLFYNDIAIDIGWASTSVATKKGVILSKLSRFLVEKKV